MSRIKNRILLLGILGVFVPDDLHRSNAAKNVLAGTVNAVAALAFILFADEAWEAAALIAVGAVVGGVLGARVGRRIPPTVLRVLVITLGQLWHRAGRYYEHLHHRMTARQRS